MQKLTHYAQFLMENSTTSAVRARSSLKNICKPKEEGDLVLRRLEEYQRVFLFKEGLELFICFWVSMICLVERKCVCKKVLLNHVRFSETIPHGEKHA